MLVEHLRVFEQTAYCVLLIWLGMVVKYPVLDLQQGNNIQINSQIALFNAAQQWRAKKREEEERASRKW